MTYTDSLKFIETELTSGSVYGLSRIKELLKILSSPEKDMKIIHIAGTNGKGSISRMIMSVLDKAGFKVGIFNSPFLERRNEYLCCNGIDASDDEYALIAGIVKNAVASMKERPTEFEFSFAMAMEYFSRKGCDFAVVECGLGGRSDATNVFESKELSIIANIGLDHIKLLGNNYFEIAKQKSGIIIKNDTVIAYPSCKEAMKVIRAVCRKKKARLILPDYIDIGNQVRYYDLGARDFDLDMGRLPSIIDSISLNGSFQKTNAMVALAGILALKQKGIRIPLAAIYEGFESVVWPGRFEKLSENPLVIADGGHNVQCAEALSRALDDEGIKKAIFVVGIMADKDYEAIFKILAPYVRILIATEPGNPRRLSCEKICDSFEKLFRNNSEEEFKAFVEKAPSNALTKAIELDRELFSDSMPIIITGSLYMMAEIRNCLKLKV